MCKAVADMIEDGRIEGRKEGRREGILSAFRRMSAKGMSASEIADMLNEPVDFVEKVLAVNQLHPNWGDGRILKKVSRKQQSEKE